MTLSGKLSNLPAPLDKTGDIAVSFKIDTSGNGSLSVAAINKLKNGHTLPGNSDPTAWDLGLATLNLTYLSLDLSMNKGVLDLDHSQVSLAVDLYLKLSMQGGGSPSDDNRRISFGDLDNNGKLQNGIVFDFSGNITWSVPSHIEVLKNEQLSFGPVDLTFSSVSIDPSPFALVITGSIAVGLDGISGGINYDNLKIGLDGTISDIGAAVAAGGGGKLSVLDAVSIEVDSIGWSNTPTTITLDENTSTGSGENMTPNKQSNTINVASYFSMKGASITLGSGSDSVMSGGFDELTVYTLTAEDGGGTGFVVRNAKLSVSDALDVTADMEYSPSPVSFQFAGSLSLPSIGVDADAVGKVGTLNGKPSFGLFVIVEGLEVPIGPGVFLNELGGGFFINPSDDDIALVRKIANFQRPELSDTITARRPGGAEQQPVLRAHGAGRVLRCGEGPRERPRAHDHHLQLLQPRRGSEPPRRHCGRKGVPGGFVEPRLRGREDHGGDGLPVARQPAGERHGRPGLLLLPRSLGHRRQHAGEGAGHQHRPGRDVRRDPGLHGAGHGRRRDRPRDSLRLGLHGRHVLVLRAELHPGRLRHGGPERAASWPACSPRRRDWKAVSSSRPTSSSTRWGPCPSTCWESPCSTGASGSA